MLKTFQNIVLTIITPKNIFHFLMPKNYDLWFSTQPIISYTYNAVVHCCAFQLISSELWLSYSCSNSDSKWSDWSLGTKIKSSSSAASDIFSFFFTSSSNIKVQCSFCSDSAHRCWTIYCDSMLTQRNFSTLVLYSVSNTKWG